ncbi:MAG: CDP-alcohol phosphatidyltransferase family protein [Chloroflexi bacterium]|nr:CDP-alcohol phosphatidyltransferase family protein [Chloroflexota bacterium]
MPSWQLYRTQARQVATRYLEAPLARLLNGVGLSPNKVTALGVLLSGGTAYLLSTGHLVGGGALLLVAGALDMADGALARRLGKSSPFGALLDSTADRVSEAIVFLGLLALYLGRDLTTEVVLVFLALFGSLMVSYLRARGEGLGVDCRVGLMTRPERVFVLAIGLMIGQVFIALAIVAALSMLTAAHRFWHIKRELARR